MRSLIVVPRFDSHLGVQAYLSRTSWDEIFGPVEAQEPPKRTVIPFFRKTALVRVAKQDGIYLPISFIEGLYHDANHPFRRVYGEMLFHTRHDRDRQVPYQCQSQLLVAYGAVYSGQVCSVTMYITPKTRMSKTLYRPMPAKQGIFLPCGEDEVTREDYTFGLLRTAKMVQDWNYCQPPLRE